jgi:hypothetical protein
VCLRINSANQRSTNAVTPGQVSDGVAFGRLVGEHDRALWETVVDLVRVKQAIATNFACGASPATGMVPARAIPHGSSE